MIKPCTSVRRTYSLVLRLPLHHWSTLRCLNCRCAAVLRPFLERVLAPYSLRARGAGDWFPTRLRLLSRTPSAPTAALSATALLGAILLLTISPKAATTSSTPSWPWTGRRERCRLADLLSTLELLSGMCGCLSDEPCWRDVASGSWRSDRQHVGCANLVARPPLVDVRRYPP